MAKFNINTYNKIRKLSVDDLMKMSKKELYDFTKITFNIAKNRQERMKSYMKEKGLEMTPAMRVVDIPHKQSKTKASKFEGSFKGYQDYDFDLKDMNKYSINELRYKFRVGQRFLNTKTSTEKGFENMLTNFGKRISKELVGDKKEQLEEKNKIKDFYSISDNYDMLWRLYREISERYAIDEKGLLTSNAVQKMIYETQVENNISSFEDLYEILRNRIDEQYQEEYEKQFDEDIFSKGIRIGKQ